MSLLRGAAAGFVATAPMTIVMEGLRRRLPREQGRRLPPREIVENAVDAVEQTSEDTLVTERQRQTLMWIAHFGFGAAAGAFYGVLTGRRGASLTTGVGYGLAVWAAAYGAGLPLTGLHRAAQDDTPERNEVLIAGHVVWGAVLGALARNRT